MAAALTVTVRKRIAALRRLAATSSVNSVSVSTSML